MPGAALDCRGNEIVVRHPRPVYVDRLLDEDELEALAEQAGDRLPHAVLPRDADRPDAAAAGRGMRARRPTCEHAPRSSSPTASARRSSRPTAGPACEPCCGACGDVCLELAAISDFRPGEPLTRGAGRPRGPARAGAARAHRDRRASTGCTGRPTAATTPTRCSTRDCGCRFSRGVRVATLMPGVVELTGIESGAGRSASIVQHRGRVRRPARRPSCTDRASPTARTTGETLQYGDRLLVTVRGDFILDECCRAARRRPPRRRRALDRRRRPYRPSAGSSEPVCPPRPSGDGVEGGEFVSWIYVEERGEQR